MRIHHLNCGTLRPLGRRRVNGNGLPFQFGRMVCHCLLIERDRSLVLVDTGFGLDDISERRFPIGSWLLPSRQHGPAASSPKLKRRRDAYTRYLTRARFDAEETAARQVARLGYSADDVRDLVLTHLDSDHAGGLRDFPAAKIHVHQREYDAARNPETPLERFRYWSHQWSHRPDWATYGASDGDGWFGFAAVRELEGLSDIALVPLPGHTRGHCGVAVQLGSDERDGNRAAWLLHAGDSYFFHGEVNPVAPRSTPALAAVQARFQVDSRARRDNQERLRELIGARGDQIKIFCSHDPVEFERFEANQRSRRPPEP